jgi:hypothetical protein
MNWIKKTLLTIGITLVASGGTSSLSYAQASWPTTEQFMSTLSVCALNLNLTIKGDLQGSIRTFYEGVKTQGELSNSTTTRFIDLFPESQRLDAYKLYTECVLKIIMSNAPKKTGQNVSSQIPVLEVSIDEVNWPPGTSGPVVIHSTGPDLFNLDYSEARVINIYHKCNGNDSEPVTFRAGVYGGYYPYNRETKELIIAENSIWNNFPQWFYGLKAQLTCIASLRQSIAYKFEFDDPQNSHFVRYFSVDYIFPENNAYVTYVGESNKSNFEAMQKLEQDQTLQYLDFGAADFGIVKETILSRPQIR